MSETRTVVAECYTCGNMPYNIRTGRHEPTTQYRSIPECQAAGHDVRLPPYLATDRIGGLS